MGEHEVKLLGDERERNWMEVEVLTFDMKTTFLPSIVYSGERLPEMSSWSTPVLRVATVV